MLLCGIASNGVKCEVVTCSADTGRQYMMGDGKMVLQCCQLTECDNNTVERRESYTWG